MTYVSVMDIWVKWKVKENQAFVQVRRKEGDYFPVKVGLPERNVMLLRQFDLFMDGVLKEIEARVLELQGVLSNQTFLNCNIPCFLQVGMFKRGDRSDWQQLIDKTEKKRKLFDDLLKGDDGGKHIFK